MSQSTLAQRLKKVQQEPPMSEANFHDYSLEQMEVMKITFGKTHLGRTFNYMWCNEQRWVTWFAQHYHASTKWEHRMFLYYVECKVERCETTGCKVPLVSVKEAAPKVESNLTFKSPMAKSQAAPPMEIGEMTAWDFEEDPEMFEVIEKQAAMTQANQMEARMASMENAINRIVQHLEENAQSSAVDQ